MGGDLGMTVAGRIETRKTALGFGTRDGVSGRRRLLEEAIRLLMV